MTQETIGARLEALYGAERGRATLPMVLELIERWRGPLAASLAQDCSSAGETRFDERDTVLIAYGDHLRRPGEAPLATLARFCRTHLKGLVSTVHVLPFHPSTSYEGYAITDYLAIDPELGSWTDLAALKGDFDLMFDLVLNHCSASHPWFGQLLAGEAPGRRYFVILPDPEAPWLQGVYRARNSPLLHPFDTAEGVRHVWTTYSPDLIDMNWAEPDVCLEFLAILFDAVAHGARVVRLDAHVYLWKAEGTTCINRPENHEIVRLFQDVLRAAGAARVAILPSITNVTQSANFEYLSDEAGQQADLIYHLPLSALLLQALYSGDATTLTRWLKALPPAPPGRAYLNLAASHDGIGLSWLQGLISDEAIGALIDEAVAHGALLSSRKRTVGDDDRPWELNATYFSACSPDPEGPPLHVERFLATQGVVLALRGVPALYLSLFVAGRNDYDRVARSGDNRCVNRGRFDADAWEARVADPGSTEAAVLGGLQGLLRIRAACAAFHPEGAQEVLELGLPPLLAIRRTPPAGGEPVACLTHFGASPLEVPLAGLGLAGVPVRDLVRGATATAADTLPLAPYQTAWLRRA